MGKRYETEGRSDSRRENGYPKASLFSEGLSAGSDGGGPGGGEKRKPGWVNKHFVSIDGRNQLLS